MRVIDAGLIIEAGTEETILVDHEGLAMIVLELSDGTRFHVQEESDGDRTVLSIYMVAHKGGIGMLVRPRVANVIWLESDKP